MYSDDQPDPASGILVAEKIGQLLAIFDIIAPLQVQILEEDVVAVYAAFSHLGHKGGGGLLIRGEAPSIGVQQKDLTCRLRSRRLRWLTLGEGSACAHHTNQQKERDTKQQNCRVWSRSPVRHHQASPANAVGRGKCATSQLEENWLLGESPVSIRMIISKAI